MKKSSKLYDLLSFGLYDHRLLVLILFGISLTIFSCKNKVNDVMVDVPVNSIHINLLSWDDALSQKDGIYLYNDIVYTGDLNNGKLDHKIKASVQLLDGLLHGFLKEVYADGQKRTLKEYRNGYEHGPQQGWHSNGGLSYHYEANRGVRQGLYQEYYPNGNLQVESFYTDGVETKRKIKDIEGDIIVNFEIRDGRYYGLLGSSVCITVFEDEQYIESYED